MAQNVGAGNRRRALQGFSRGTAITIGTGLVFSLLLRLGAQPLSAVFLAPGSGAMALSISYLELISWFYFLAFSGHSFVGWYRGTGRMSITFWGTTIQILARVAGTYLLVGAMGLDAVALATGAGWLLIAAFQITVFVLERRGIWPRQASL